MLNTDKRMKHNVELKLMGNNLVPYIDGVRFSMHSNGIEPNDENGELKFCFDKQKISFFFKNAKLDLSEHLESAVVVLRNELLKHDDFYDRFLESIKSSLDEQRECLPYRNTEWIAEEILKRIIGEE